MALTRRDLLLGLPLLGLAACSSGTAGTLTHVSTPRELGSSVAAGKPTVLVAMPDTKQTREVWTGLKDELKGRFSLFAVKVEGEGGADTLAAAIAAHRPACIVLMNNPTVFAYARYQATTHLAS